MNCQLNFKVVLRFNYQGACLFLKSVHCTFQAVPAASYSVATLSFCVSRLSQLCKYNTVSDVCQQVFFKIFRVFRNTLYNVITSYSIHYTKLYDAYRFNGRTAQPLEPATAPGCDEPTSRCQTTPSMWTLGSDKPVIPRVAFIRWAMAIPLYTTGSLSPTFVPARITSYNVCYTKLLRVILKQ